MLVAAEDLDVRLALCRLLEMAGYATATARDEPSVLAALTGVPYQLIVLDSTLSERLTELCSQIRGQTSAGLVVAGPVPGPAAVVAWLDAGADAVVAAPYEPDELLAHCRAVLRRVAEAPRTGAGAMPALMVGPLWFEPAARGASFRGNPLPLTAKELRVLYVLAENVGRAVSRGFLIDRVWAGLLEPESKSLDTTVSRMRRKLREHDDLLGCLKTIYRRGYMLSSEVQQL